MRQFAILTALAALAACGQQTAETAANEAASANEVRAERITPVDKPTDGDGTPPGENTPTSVSGSADDEMRWNFARSARGPKLTYGEPATDNVKLALRCRGSDGIELSFMRASPVARSDDSMIVAAGGAELQVDSTVEQTELGPVMIRGVTPISSGPIQNFRSGSGLEVRWRGETISVPPAAEQARQLLDACRA